MCELVAQLHLPAPTLSRLVDDAVDDALDDALDDVLDDQLPDRVARLVRALVELAAGESASRG